MINMWVRAFDAVRVPEAEWDATPEEEREPYIIEFRKNGYVCAIKTTEEQKGGE
jgi:hypothetical protein